MRKDSKVSNMKSINRNPFMGEQFLDKDKSVSVNVIADTEGRSKKKKYTNTITKYGKVEKEGVLDLFCKIIQKKLGLTKGGIITFKYLYNQVQQSRGLNAENLSLIIDKQDCMNEAGYTSIQSVFNGVNELLEKSIIAKSGKPTVYFLNPNFFRPADYLIVTEYYKVNNG